MANDLDFDSYDDDVDSIEIWAASTSRNTSGRDSRRVIEALREERRLKELLTDYDLDDDLDDE